MVEEFAEIERKLGEQLKISNTQNISSEEFLDLKKRLGMAKQLIATFEKQGDRKKELLTHEGAAVMNQMNLF